MSFLLEANKLTFFSVDGRELCRPLPDPLPEARGLWILGLGQAQRQCNKVSLLHEGQNSELFVIGRTNLLHILRRIIRPPTLSLSHQAICARVYQHEVPMVAGPKECEEGWVHHNIFNTVCSIIVAKL